MIGGGRLVFLSATAAVLMLSTSLCLAQTEAPAITAYIHNICVKHFHSIPITDSEVDDILARATAILAQAAQNKEACGNLSLRRRDSVTSFTSEFPERIRDELDFTQIKQDPCLKVVKRILWCGTLLQSGGALGCAPVSGTGFAVVRRYPGMPDDWNTNMEPITWLHELGHTLGLNHNDVDSLALMAAGIDVGNRVLNGPECRVFAGMTMPAAAPLAAQAAILPAEAGILLAQVEKRDRDEATRPSLQEFLRRPHSRFPQEEAARYADERLLAEQLLLDPQYRNFANNIAATLGVIGTPDTIPILEQFLKSEVHRPTEADITARSAATLAIGVIANRYGLPVDDFRVLREAQNTDFWLDRLEPTPSSANPPADQSEPVLDAADVESASEDLAVQAYRGYAISGAPEVLEDIKKDELENDSAAIPEPTKKRNALAIEEAIELHRMSKTLGASSVFK